MTDTRNISISVVIPAYNCERYIRRSLDSIMNQTQPVDEIIVIDDGSTDTTAEVVRTYGEKVRYIHQENAGVSAARNTGILAATCDWIAFLDADDEWLPQKIQLQTDVLIRNPELVWVGGNYLTCLCNEKRRAPRLNPVSARQFMKTVDTVDDFFVAVNKGLAEHTDTMLIHKDVLTEAGLFEISMSKAEDIDLWWKIAHRHPALGYISQPLAIHHFGNENSLNRVPMNAVMITDLLRRHEALARGTATVQSFHRMISNVLRKWIRSMLFHAQKKDIRELLRNFKELISPGRRCMIYLLTVFPGVTKSACMLISKIVRTLHLRRQVVVPPATAKSKKDVS